MRQVTPDDAPELARLIQSVELDDNPNVDWIARLILSTTRVTLVEEQVGALVGFIDAFMTVSAEGLPRWEIDLVGVYPNYRGRGIAQRLIAASVDAGREQGARLTRALIHLDNAASANAFQRCGFVAAQATRELYVSDTPLDDAPAARTCPAHLIPVSTLTYSGVWIEGDHSPESLHAARAVREKYGWFIAGALLPTGSPAPEAFARVGEYRWWALNM